MGIKKEYTPLTGTAHGTVSGRHRLWQGPDHLIYVVTNGFSERYRRFYYSGIQAVLVYETRWWVVYNIILALTAVPLTLVFVLAGWPWVPGILLCGPLYFLLFLNSLRGPTCDFVVRTAVQEEKILSVRRMKKAHKVLERIVPLIEAAQRDLATSENAGEAATATPRAETEAEPVAAAAEAGGE